jgi:hypothetical protein
MLKDGHAGFWREILKNGRIIIKWLLRKYGEREWIEFL